jgi:POT family proton-dependent oligopeptide transporter
MENKHPAALKILCMTEAGERYGFYTIQSLIAVYLSLAVGLGDAKIYILVGSFTALTYISPFMGGWIADHFLGQKNAILWGTFILSASYLSFAFFHSLSSIIAALAAIAIGTGLVKPNVSSLLGHQYANDNPKKNNGFLIFYMELMWASC